MGLMPIFRIVANGDDITELLTRHATMLQLVDEAGTRSDKLKFELANPSRQIAVPSRGAELEIWLPRREGTEYGQLVKVGKFFVHKVASSGWPRKMKVEANAAPPRSQRSGIVEAGTRFADLVDELAAASGMETVFDTFFNDVTLPHRDQVDESDASFLTRIGREVGAVVKYANGALIVTRPGSNTSASGRPLTPVSLRPSDVTRFNAEISDTFAAGTVVARYVDLDDGGEQDVIVGEGNPTRRLRHSFADESQARAAANAELARGDRGKSKLRATVVGNADLMAEGPLSVSDVDDLADGQWTISKVTHRINSQGYSCDIEAEDWRPPEGNDE